MSNPETFSLAEFLFDDRGRVGRKGFWSFCLIGVLVAVIILIAVGPRRMLVAHQIFGIAMIYPCYCVFSKRLQDLDVPGAWAILMVAVSAVDIALALVGLSQRPGWPSKLARAWNYISNFNLMVVLILLGTLPGTPAKNRFGTVPDL